MSGKKGYIVRNQRNKNQLLFLTFILRTFDKNFAQLHRDSHDFAVVSVASACKVEDGIVTDARIVLGAVAPIPLRAKEAEAFIIGKAVTEELAAEAAEIALQGALPLSKNGYKVQIAKTLVRNSLLNARTPLRSEDSGADK